MNTLALQRGDDFNFPRTLAALYFISTPQCRTTKTASPSPHLSLILLFSPRSSSPLQPLPRPAAVMDFSCDVGKRYLLWERIDCVNGREQRAKREEKEGNQGGPKKRAPRESISLIRRRFSARMQYAAGHKHEHVHALTSGFFGPGDMTGVR